MEQELSDKHPQSYPLPLFLYMPNFSAHIQAWAPTKHDLVENVETSFSNSKKPLEKACGPKIHFGPSASKKGSFRVKFSLFLAEFLGDLCMQDCSLNEIAFIQIAPPFLIMSEFTLCTNLPQSTIIYIYSLLNTDLISYFMHIILLLLKDAIGPIQRTSNDEFFM